MLAARTSTLTLGLLVGGVTYRNPALHAKITTTLDIISGGRVWHGIGAAWFEDEHNAYGFAYPPLKERFERLEEALQITRSMFTQERTSFSGKYYTVDGAFNNPKPLRGDIPIVIGGSGERKTLRMVAQYADGCNLFGDPDRVRHLLGVLAGHCENVGRDPAEITKTGMGVVAIGATHEAAEAKVDMMRQAGLPAGADRERHRRRLRRRGRACPGAGRRRPGGHDPVAARRPRPRGRRAGRTRDRAGVRQRDGRLSA